MKTKTRNLALIFTGLYLIFSMAETIFNVIAPHIFISNPIPLSDITNLLANTFIYEFSKVSNFFTTTFPSQSF